MMLSRDAQRVKGVPNAGGSSVISEMLSAELLIRCFSATLLKTEMEVSYFPEGGSITDFVVSMFDRIIGVSVTRAFNYCGSFCEEDAVKLLNKKLNGILQSTENTMIQWSKQILHVWTPSEYITDMICKTFELVISRTTKSNTVLLITTAADCHDIFFNRMKPKFDGKHA